ncbi:MAG: DciA family protein [Rhodospirillum sp.]|nr:DciA family protein [Rhodospirillum sp.]MCF8491887.1 DciA family protein [Rhodospirillum sp.]MCF8502265.1 DciA family protein [Rhodospirillum sp.]
MEKKPRGAGKEEGAAKDGKTEVAPPPRRSRRIQALSAVTFKAALSVLSRRGLAEESLLSNWDAVVGPLLATRSHPQRLQRPRKGEAPDGGGGCVLHLKVEGGAVAMEIQHRVPQIIERVNGFLGWPAVGRITLHQGRVRRSIRPQRKDPPPLSPERRAALDAELAGVDDPDLRAALARLGEAVGRLSGEIKRR